MSASTIGASGVEPLICTWTASGRLAVQVRIVGSPTLDVRGEGWSIRYEPASTINIWPVTLLANGPHKYRAALPTSSAEMLRRNGAFFSV